MAKTIGAAKSQSNDQPLPTEHAKLQLKVLEARRNLGEARRGSSGTFVPLMLYWLAWFYAFHPVRVILLYIQRSGPLMAAGIAYRMFFAVAALLVAGISILGLIVAGNRELQLLVVQTVDATTPGLIDTTGNGAGFASAEEIFSATRGFGTALLISTLVMVVTSLSWIAGIRQGMRGVLDLPPVQTNPVLLRVKDLGALLVLGVALILTTAAGLVANTVIDLVIELLRLENTARPATRIASVVIMLVLDVAVAAILFRRASAVQMPRKVLLQSALIAGVGSTLLRTFSTLLLGNVDNSNQLLAPFAVILGLFIWFFLLSQVYLIATAWGAIGMADMESTAKDESRGGGGRSLRQRSRTAKRTKP